MLFLGYAFSCGCKNRLFFVNTNLFFTEIVYSLEIFLFCIGKRGTRCGFLSFFDIPKNSRIKNSILSKLSHSCECAFGWLGGGGGAAN